MSVLAILVIFVIGYLLAVLILGQDAKCFIELFVISFALGAGFLSIEMFFLSWLGFKMVFFNILLLVAFNLILLFILNLKYNNGFFTQQFGFRTTLTKVFNLSLIEIVLTAVILFNVILVFVDSMAIPISNWDAIAIWSLKAKILFNETIKHSNYFFEPSKSFSHLDYPLLVPFVQVYLYSILGYIDDRLVKIIFPIFFVCILLTLYFAQRRYFSRIHSLVFASFLSTLIPFIIETSSGYADVPLTLFYFLSVVYLYVWIKEGKLKYILLAALFSSFMVFTKNEGLGLLVINILVLLIFNIFNYKNERIKQSLIYVLISVLLILPWMIFRQRISILTENYLAHFNILGIINNLDRVNIVFVRFIQEFINVSKWNIMWILLVITIFINIKNIFKNTAIFLLLFIICHLSLYYFIYIITPWENVSALIDSSLERLLIHVAPLVLFYISKQVNYLNRSHFK